ncbi:MAG: D-Ala-D-Ala carboxypeptidase family metallohydrolase, partial [Solirubrobacterales bacterium]
APARAGLAAALAAVALGAGALAVGPAGASSSGNLEGRIAASQARGGELSSGIHADSRQIEGFQGSIDDLQTRLSALEGSLALERAQLAKLKSELASARRQMAALQVQLGHDKQALVAQVVASYEAPPPSIVTVIMEAHGFADLIERFDDLQAISRENAQATVLVANEHRAVAAQAAELAELEGRQQRATGAMAVQRDEVAQLHLALVDRQLQYIHARDRKSSELGALHSHQHALEHELATIQTRELAAAGNSLAYTGPVGPVNLSTDGDYGFFQAAGTNYSVGEEPQIAARLNTLGKALHLHLIGVSGYRSPQHSVEVGGFANDPHTRGEASDTPGVEGVPEATLERFGLTRPFPGAAEADHIQLLGSAH